MSGLLWSLLENQKNSGPRFSGPTWRLVGLQVLDFSMELEVGRWILLGVILPVNRFIIKELFDALAPLDDDYLGEPDLLVEHNDARFRVKRDGLRVFELCNQRSIAIDVRDVVDNGDVFDGLFDFEDGSVGSYFGNGLITCSVRLTSLLKLHGVAVR